MLFGKRGPFYSYERAILDALVAAVPPSVAHTLQAQMDQIRRVQRSPASPEINFYASRKGGGWDDSWLFPNLDEVVLANIAVRVDGRSHKGTLHAVSGHIFSLVIRPAVAHPRRAVVEGINIDLADIGLLTAPRAGPSSAPEIIPDSFLEREIDTEADNAGRWAILERDDVYVVALRRDDWAVLAQGPQGHLLLGRSANGYESFLYRRRRG